MVINEGSIKLVNIMTLKGGGSWAYQDVKHKLDVDLIYDMGIAKYIGYTFHVYFGSFASVRVYPFSTCFHKVHLRI